MPASLSTRCRCLALSRVRRDKDMKLRCRYGIGAVAMSAALAACGVAERPSGPLPSAETFRAGRFEIRSGGAAESVNGAWVTAAFLGEAKAQPLLGRWFLPEEYRGSGTRVAVVASSLWQRRFGGDPALIGRVLSVDGQPCTIVGILPKTFHAPDGAEIWMPQTP